jgi:DNA-binding CsgD family transcriptional regulator
VDLTPKQGQVLGLAGLEYTTGDIARLIDREPKTIESHLDRVGAVMKVMHLGKLLSDGDKLLKLAKLDEGAP